MPQSLFNKDAAFQSETLSRRGSDMEACIFIKDSSTKIFL